MMHDSILADLTMPNKFHFMKKLLFCAKSQFCYMRGTANFDENFYVMEAKKDSLEKPLICCSGPEFFKMGQNFYFCETNAVNEATWVVSIPI